jgi:hypothetical protein
MDRGYVKLWRKTLDSGVLRSPEYFAFFCYCLLKASWKKRTEFFNGVEIELEPGQFIFGRKAAMRDLGTTEQKIRTLIKKAIKNNYISTIRSTTRYSIYFIINWRTYQADATLEQPSNQRPTNAQLTEDQQPTNHIQEGKEFKEGKKEKKEKKELKTLCDNPADDHGYIDAGKKYKRFPNVSNDCDWATNILANKIQENNPNFSHLKGPEKYANTMGRWSQDIDKINRIDGYSWEQIRAVIEWCQSDSFWKSNILSGSKLRKQFDQLVVKMEAEKEPQKVKSQVFDAIDAALKMEGPQHDPETSKAPIRRNPRQLPVPRRPGEDNGLREPDS